MRTLRTLSEVRVASPCPARWEEMVGDDRVRFCSECRKNVYNLSVMTEAAALELVRSREGICGLLYRRRDGSVLTADCPVGRAAFHRRVLRRVLATAASLLLAVGGRFFTPTFRAACEEIANPAPSVVPSTAAPAAESSNEDLELMRLLGYLS